MNITFKEDYIFKVEIVGMQHTSVFDETIGSKWNRIQKLNIVFEYILVSQRRISRDFAHYSSVAI